jgi:serine protein kinase
LSYDSNGRLRRAFETEFIEDQKDSIWLSSFVFNVIDKDKETRRKIDIIDDRLVNDDGYDDASAKDVPSYVASIVARSDLET